MSSKPPVAVLIAGMAERLGLAAFVSVGTDLMAGADRGGVRRRAAQPQRAPLEVR